MKQKQTKKEVKEIIKKYGKTFDSLGECVLHQPIRFMFAVVQEDNYGQAVNLFKTKKQAKQFYKLVK